MEEIGAIPDDLICVSLEAYFSFARFSEGSTWNSNSASSNVMDATQKRTTTDDELRRNARSSRCQAPFFLTRFLTEDLRAGTTADKRVYEGGIPSLVMARSEGLRNNDLAAEKMLSLASG